MSTYISSGQIAADDRGFRYGDGVFETIYVDAGRALLWPKHIERLQAGLDAIAIDFDATNLTAKAKDVWASSKLESGFLRIAISRGVGSQGYAPTATTPTIVIECLPPAPAPASLALAVSKYEKISPKSLPTHVKTAQGLQSTLAQMEAKTLGVDDVILLTAQGHISEISCANLFWLKDGKLYTPSLETGALAGVTRGAILESSPIPIEQGLFSLTDMQNAQAAFATNVRFGICPVARLGEHQFNPAHPALAAIHAALQQHINKLTW